MATVRGKTMEPAERDTSRQEDIIPVTVHQDAVPAAVTLVERVKAEAAGVRLEDAEIVISGGRGLKGPDDFQAVLTPCAKVLRRLLEPRVLPSMRAGCRARCRWG